MEALYDSKIIWLNNDENCILNKFDQFWLKVRQSTVARSLKGLITCEMSLINFESVIYENYCCVNFIVNSGQLRNLFNSLQTRKVVLCIIHT